MLTSKPTIFSHFGMISIDGESQTSNPSIHSLTLYHMSHCVPHPIEIQGFFQQFWEKAPGQNWDKMIDLTAKLGEINDIELNKGSKNISSKSSYLRLYNANHTT